MGHQYQTEGALPSQSLKHCDDVVLGVFIEVAGGLVGQQQTGSVDERPRDGHAPLLAAGQFHGIGVDPIPQPCTFQQCVGSRISVAGIQRTTKQCR